MRKLLIILLLLSSIVAFGQVPGITTVVPHFADEAPAQDIEFVALDQNYSSSATSIAVNVPTGTQSGDVMLAFVNINTSGQTINAITGWTKEIDYDAANVTATTAVLSRVATGSEPTDYTFDGWNSDRCRVLIVTYRNVDTTTPIEVFNNESAISANPLTASSINTLSNGAMLLFSAYLDTSGEISGSVPTGMTGRNTVATGNVILLFDELRPTAGATGSRTSTLSSGAGKMFQLISLKPN